MKINAGREGYYKIMEGDVVIEQKSSEVEAMQGLINYQLEGRNVRMVPPSYRVDIEQGSTIEVPAEEIIYAEGYVHMTAYDGTQYLRIGDDKEIIRLVSGPRARKGQGKFILKRKQTVDFIDQYELYGDQPFEIENNHEVVDYEAGLFRVWATEKWRVEYFINGVRDDVASDPVDLPIEQYNSSLTEEDMYRHTRTLDATYGDRVLVRAHNGYGESDDFEVSIETLHQLDQSARIKQLNEEISAIMQEPEPQ